ncbi:carbon-nitrogen hydrolase family protein [Paucibacter sp. O1-1]|nr:carbon-nitrogen hydrolase family protein [Paucibacter sp. O1-1]MDA3825833.1 carbon-nitrogen hydrolase family protein [Paucibacter sp. O1-1]
MKIAAIQMVSGPDVALNLARARHWLAEAAAQGARLAALPEYFCLIGLKDEDKLAIAEAPGAGPIQQALADAARELGLWIIGGTLPLRTADPARVRNSCLVFAPDGSQAARYDKMHLFCYDNGRERYDEGRVLQAGEAPVAAQVEKLRVGLSVCYDLRFPELYRSLGPLDLISVPAAFTHTTGQAHWELLLRARAVENLAYLIAPAQGGTHQNGRRTWGHTMIVDPWGEVLACLPEGEGVVLAEIDTARLAQLRQQLPALQHRRL